MKKKNNFSKIDIYISITIVGILMALIIPALAEYNRNAEKVSNESSVQITAEE